MALLVNSRPRSETVSPELVLVDPVLAAVERACLSLPSAHSHAARGVPLRDGPGHRRAFSAATHRPADDASSSARPWWPRLLVVVVISSLWLLLVDLNFDLGGSDAPLREQAAPLKSTSSGRLGPLNTSENPSAPDKNPSAPDTNPSAPDTPRRFAWAPVTGAEGYHVELFLRDQRVFSADSKVPSITVPQAWTYDRKKRVLEAGTYRWYVWPIVAGRRAARAVVQATVSVS